jgi:thioredoxin 1
VTDCAAAPVGHNPAMETTYATSAPDRAEVDAMAGPTVLEFGTDWCGWCRGAQPFIVQALGDQADLRHIKVEDGPGRPLGRSFRVKLWPTLIFLRDGRELARVTRPGSSDELREALAKIA